MRYRTIVTNAILALLAAAGLVGCSGDVPSTHARHASRAPKRRAGSPPPRRVSGPHDSPVPILMYHVIADPQPGTTYPELFVSPPVFEAQMRALRSRGYHAVTLAQVERYWRRGYALPKKPIVLTFDDGYLSDYTRARPVLGRLGWPGVLNLEVNNVRTAGDITAHQVSKLIGDGWEIDSHTITHPDLTTLSAARLRTELVGSRNWLRRRFHVPVDYFCYPAGRFNRSVEDAVRAAGYRLATTTQPGLARPSEPLALDRIRVDRSDGVAGLLGQLAAPDAVTAAAGSG